MEDTTDECQFYQSGPSEVLSAEEAKDLLDHEKNKEWNKSDKVPQIRLPPLPQGIRKYSEEERKQRYDGNTLDHKDRIHFKLFKLWTVWGNIRMNEDIERLLMEQDENDPSYKESDEFKCKCIIVDILDALGKILGDTPIVEELAWLKLSPEDFEKTFKKKSKST